MNRTRRRSAGLGCITLVAVFFLAVMAFGLAYQARPGYKIEVGSRLDEPYVAGFRTREPPDTLRKPGWDGFDYRFTTYESKIDLPGVGSQPLTVTLRVSPSINPNPNLKIFVNEKNQIPAQYLKIPPGEAFQILRFPVPANFFADGNLHLKLQTDLWVPAEVDPKSKDSRKLGLLVDWVQIEPGPSASSGFNLVRPPDDIFIPLVISSLLVLLIFLSIGLPPPYALLASLLAVGGVSYWLVNDRLNLTELISRDFVRSLFFIWVAVYSLAEFGPKLFQSVGMGVTRRETGWLAAIFLLQFMLLWGVMSHPQFSSSDLGLNIHRLADAQQGNLIFPQKLPNGQLAPYPPAYYLGLLPFTNFTDGSDSGFGALIKVVSALLQASEVFFIFYLSSLLRRPQLVTNRPLEEAERQWEMGTNWAGLCAAAFYTLCKYPYYIFSQGNHTNLFGLWALLLFFCVTAGTLTYLRRHPTSARRVRVAVAAPETEKFKVANPGSRSYTALLDPPEPTDDEAAGPSLSQRYFVRLVRLWQQKIWPVVAVTLRYLVPLALLVLVFTSHYGTFIYANIFTLVYIAVLAGLGGLAGRREAIYLAACYVGALLIAFLLYYQHVTNLMGSPGGKAGKPLSPALLLDMAAWLWRIGTTEFGWIVIVAALVGLGLRGIQADWRASFRHLSPVAAGLIALTLSLVLLAGLDFVLEQESRFQLYMLPLVALAAGAFFGRIWRTGWAGVGLVVAVFIFQLIQVLAFWLERVTYYFQL